jgi:DNA-directed RNA polymerase specialized sigma24 family protein
MKDVSLSLDRAASLFCRALELENKDRAAFVMHECPNDLALRTLVLRLLENHKLGRWLETLWPRSESDSGARQSTPDLSSDTGPRRRNPKAPGEMLSPDEALRALERCDARAAQVALLRVFAGLSVAEIATTLGVSAQAVEGEWAFARSYLAVMIAGAREGNPR